MKINIFVFYLPFSTSRYFTKIESFFLNMYNNYLNIAVGSVATAIIVMDKIFFWNTTRSRTIRRCVIKISAAIMALKNNSGNYYNTSTNVSAKAATSVLHDRPSNPFIAVQRT